jgi:hypothetical protein
MKHFIVLVSSFLLLVLSSCAGGGTVTFHSPDQYTQIVVSAESASVPMDPLMVTVSVHSPSFKRDIQLEAQMNSLNEATCSVEWKDARTAYLRLQERDETSRLIEVISDSVQLSIRLIDRNE